MHFGLDADAGDDLLLEQIVDEESYEFLSRISRTTYPDVENWRLSYEGWPDGDSDKQDACVVTDAQNPSLHFASELCLFFLDEWDLYHEKQSNAFPQALRCSSVMSRV